jgi:hypothetical protein
LLQLLHELLLKIVIHIFFIVDHQLLLLILLQFRLELLHVESSLPPVARRRPASFLVGSLIDSARLTDNLCLFVLFLLLGTADHAKESLILDLVKLVLHH